MDEGLDSLQRDKGEKGIMPSKQISININELAESIRQRYGYEAVSIDKIFAGARLTDMKTIGLGSGAILDMQIMVREKETNEETELNQKEHIELLGLIKDMEEMKEAVEELIEKRKEKINDGAKILNARVEGIKDINLYREIISLVVNRSGKRYLLEAKATKDQVGVCRPWINVEELK